MRRRRRWLAAEDFERAIAATSLLPGPSSTQLAIYCAWRLRGTAGALLGGALLRPARRPDHAAAVGCLPRVAPPAWLRGAGAGAGAAVAAVAVHAGLELARPIWSRTPSGRRGRVVGYGLAGAVAAAVTGPWLVLVLLACGGVELLARRWPAARPGGAPRPLAAAMATGGLGALAWTAFKVGALAYGGGFVIVPLMQGDAVDTYGWMTDAEFVNAVALGQVTPGPVVATIAAVGYAAHGVAGALLASGVAFAPSFAFVLLGADRFERLIASPVAESFLGARHPRRSAQSSAPPSRSPRRSASRGRSPSLAQRPFSCCCCAAASSSRCCSRARPAPSSRSPAGPCPPEDRAAR